MLKVLHIITGRNIVVILPNCLKYSYFFFMQFSFKSVLYNMCLVIAKLNRNPCKNVKVINILISVLHNCSYPVPTQ